MTPEISVLKVRRDELTALGVRIQQVTEAAGVTKVRYLHGVEEQEGVFPGTLSPEDLMLQVRNHALRAR